VLPQDRLVANGGDTLAPPVKDLSTRTGLRLIIAGKGSERTS